MRIQVTATETLLAEDAARLERHGWKPVVRWEKHIEGGRDGSGTDVVCTSKDALTSVQIHERRSARGRRVASR